MQGIACLMQNRIFVYAKGQCPICRKRFPVACVITDDRHVHRVLVPDFLFGLWLRLAVRDMPQPVHHRDWELPETSHHAEGMVLNEEEPITRSEQVLGQFDGLEISSWIEYKGQRYHFERAAPPGGLKLCEGEVLLHGKLIYLLNQPQQA